VASDHRMTTISRIPPATPMMLQMSSAMSCPRQESNLRRAD
jgi:hypothetical protein